MSRYSIDTIAEILIEKTDQLKKSSEILERATQRKLQIDSTELRNLIEEQKENQRAILSDFKALKKENSSRVSNFVFIAIVVAISVNVGIYLYNMKIVKDYNYMELKLEHYQNELQKIQNGNKKSKR